MSNAEVTTIKWRNLVLGALIGALVGGTFEAFAEGGLRLQGPILGGLMGLAVALWLSTL